MYKALVGFLIRFRILGLMTIAVITGFFATQTIHMEMYTQFLDLFPHNHPYVQVHKKYSKYFGSAYQASLMLEVKEGTVFNIDTLEKISRIQMAVDLIPGVDHFGISSLASPRETVARETPDGISVKPIMKDPPRNTEEINDLRRKVFTDIRYTGIKGSEGIDS